MQQLETLNQLITEFYDKMSAWEQAAVKETGYSLPQVHTIEALGCHGAMKMSELAQKLSVTTGTLTVQVDKLESAQLLKRQAHPSDRRATVVELTKKGLEIHRHHNQLHLNLVKQLTEQLDAEQQQLLSDFLSKMNRAF